MRTLKALSKQLFGAHYQQIGKSFVLCLILFVALYAAEIRVVIAPFILYLTATFFTFGVMCQALGASQNAKSMIGLFLLPFNGKKFAAAYVAAFSGYTLITKTALILAVFFAICPWTVPQIFTAVLCSCNGCLMAAAWYALTAKKWLPLAMLWCVCIALTILFVRAMLPFLCIVEISICLSVLYLRTTDPYLFYQSVSAKGIVKHHGKHGSVFVYLLRYLLSNKNYLINTVGLCAVACFFPFLFGEIEGLNVIPLGFAILCLNTPLGVLLSCDPDLEQAIRFLPRQSIQFCSWYCIFIATVNMAVSSFYLCSWQLQNGSIGALDVLAGVLFAIQSAILSVLLEWLHPIRNWKIETDLWHHPRKYIVPLLMIGLAVVIGTWPTVIWIWCSGLLSECLFVFMIAGRCCK